MTNLKLNAKEIRFESMNQRDNVYLTIDKCSENVIFSTDKWINSDELLWVRIYSDGLAEFGLTKLKDPFHGYQKYTWSSRAEIINKELLKGTPYSLITSDIGVKELQGKYHHSYLSKGVCSRIIMPLVEANSDKLNYGLEAFKAYELRYV